MNDSAAAGPMIFISGPSDQRLSSRTTRADVLRRKAFQKGRDMQSWKINTK